MCSKGTLSPHLAHTRWYLMRPWSSSWSWLKDRPFSSVAGNTLIGIDTSPNEMAPFHMVLGMISTSAAGPQIVLVARLATRTFPSSMDSDAQAETDRPCVHSGVPARAPGRPGRGGLVGRDGRPGDPAVEPEQGVLAGGGLHEGRPARLLLQRRRPHPPLPRG